MPGASTEGYVPVELTLTYDATTDVAYPTLRGTGPTDVYGPTLTRK